MNTVAVETESSQVDFHKGNMLLRVANTYSSLLLTIIEGVQNSIDGSAQHIFVGIDYRTRKVIIADDGQGVDKGTFELALKSVGQTVKRDDKLGRFGLGLISPLNKCTNFTFTSAAMPTRRSIKWTFNAKAIKAQAQTITVPSERFAGLPQLSKTFKQYATGVFGCSWRTMVTMNGVVQDRVISTIDLDELEGEMLAKLGTRMRELAIQVRVVMIDSGSRVQQRDICATAFAGEALPVVTYRDQDAGRVEFQLYRAPKLAGKRRGRVTVGEMNNPAAISIRDFSRQTRTSRWKEFTEAALTALNSGYFEGTITCEKISLHPERSKFEGNDALYALFMTVGQWYSEHGKQHYENEQEVSREKRYQALGLKSQEKFLALLARPEFAKLRDVLQSSVQIGRMGDGHAAPSRGKPDGIEEVASLRVGQGGAGKSRTAARPQPPGRRSASAEPKDRPGDVPLGVEGPNGQHRRLVKGDSQGLWYEHSVLPGNSHLWEFDFRLGILTFNVRHPVWVSLDETKGKHTPKNAQWIMRLQEWLTLEVLHLMLAFPDAMSFEDHRTLIDNKIKSYVELFILDTYK